MKITFTFKNTITYMFVDMYSVSNSKFDKNCV